MDPWYSSPVFVDPVIWICFLSGIIWASQPWKYGTSTHNPTTEEME
jgi:hypothetical protein